MIVLVAGAHGRLDSRVVGVLLRRGHLVRALVRTPAHAAVLQDAGAETVVADLSHDVEWTAEGCNAAVFAAAARHRSELGSIDAGGAAKLAEAADRYDFRHFLLSSVVGADRPERRNDALRERDRHSTVESVPVRRRETCTRLTPSGASPASRVWATYRDWTRATTADAVLARAMYEAAVDREDGVTTAYARLMTHACGPTGGPRHTRSAEEANHAVGTLMESDPDRPGLIEVLSGEANHGARIALTVALCVLLVLAGVAAEAVLR